MKNWCKIIETKKYDVLVQRLSDNDNEEHISISLLCDGVLACLKPGFGDDEKRADEAYINFNKAAAERTVKDIVKMLS
jgi:hypothetical protein